MSQSRSKSSNINQVLESSELSEIKGLAGRNLTKESINRILFSGENLEIMRKLVLKHNLSKSVNLVYIDPPFASKNTFRVGKTRTSTMSPSATDSIAYSDSLVGKEYLDFLKQRLIIIRELMADNGSIYFHIDYKIGHYVKIIMDEVFGIENFRNDITRIKCNPKNFSRKGYGNIKDMILFYTKSEMFTWNEPREGRDLAEIDRLFNRVDESGRRYTTNPLHAPGETLNGESGKPWNGLKPPEGRHWRYSHAVMNELEAAGLIEWSKSGVPRKKIYPEDFTTKRVQDIWEFKDKPNPIYPTEKNLDMLTRIIQTSSNENDLVFDAFCGSGSFLFAAERCQRRWIGIDSSEEAIKVTKSRFETNQESLFNELPVETFIV
ncbi:MAG: site-specific DNA-methyltransferase [Acidobacteria bacterium]|nr:site-specific DNA-methyltransferase [Acidobacteriota bacterium]